MMRRNLWALLGCLAAAQAGADVSKLNGSIRVASGHSPGDVSTVNGSIVIEANATVEDAEAVNGRVELGESAQARSLQSVNGSIEVDRGARVERDIRTVNGSISLGPDAEAGGIENVNGSIRLERARLRGGIKTVQGDIDIGAGSRVEGGIFVQEPNGRGRSDRREIPRIVIGPDAVVGGTLRFEREVELHVSDRAKIGPVEGAKPIAFSGDTPGR